MKTNFAKLTQITVGIISIGILLTGAISLWIWGNTNYFSHRMFQNNSMMYAGSSLWGTFLIGGIVLLIGAGVIALLNKTAQIKSIDTPLCLKCGEELTNPDWDFCPLCGDPTKNE